MQEKLNVQVAKSCEDTHSVYFVIIFCLSSDI